MALHNDFDVEKQGGVGYELYGRKDQTCACCKGGVSSLIKRIKALFKKKPKSELKKQLNEKLMPMQNVCEIKRGQSKLWKLNIKKSMPDTSQKQSDYEQKLGETLQRIQNSRDQLKDKIAGFQFQSLNDLFSFIQIVNELDLNSEMIVSYLDPKISPGFKEYHYLLERFHNQLESQKKQVRRIVKESKSKIVDLLDKSKLKFSEKTFKKLNKFYTMVLLT